MADATAVAVAKRLIERDAPDGATSAEAQLVAKSRATEEYIAASACPCGAAVVSVEMGDGLILRAMREGEAGVWRELGSTYDREDTGRMIPGLPLWPNGEPAELVQRVPQADHDHDWKPWALDSAEVRPVARRLRDEVGWAAEDVEQTQVHRCVRCGMQRLMLRRTDSDDVAAVVRSEEPEEAGWLWYQPAGPVGRETLSETRLFDDIQADGGEVMTAEEMEGKIAEGVREELAKSPQLTAGPVPVEPQTEQDHRHRHVWGEPPTLRSGVFQAVVEKLRKEGFPPGNTVAGSNACTGCGVMMIEVHNLDTHDVKRALREPSVDRGPWHLAIGDRDFESFGAPLWEREPANDPELPAGLVPHMAQAAGPPSAEEIVERAEEIAERPEPNTTFRGAGRAWRVGIAGHKDDRPTQPVTAELTPLGDSGVPDFDSVLVPRSQVIHIGDGETAYSPEQAADVLAQLTRHDEPEGGYHYEKHREVLERAFRDLVDLTPRALAEIRMASAEARPLADVEVSEEAMETGQHSVVKAVAAELGRHYNVDIWTVAVAFTKAGYRPDRAEDLEDRIASAESRRLSAEDKAKEAEARANALKEASVGNTLVSTALLKIVEPLVRELETARKMESWEISRTAQKALDEWDTVEALVDPTRPKE